MSAIQIQASGSGAGTLSIAAPITASNYTLSLPAVTDTFSTQTTVNSRIQPITASVAASALTVTLNPTTLDFRATPLTSGTVNTRTVGSAISVVVSSGSTLGTVSAQQSRIVVIALDNAGTIELAVVNISGGNNLDETTLISTTAEGGAGAADSANVVYSTTARTSLPYRVVGYVESTQATAGTWATAPSTIQGYGGQALAAMSSLGYGQTWQDVTASRASATTYYNTTGRPITWIITMAINANVQPSINGVSVAASAVNSSANRNSLTVIIPPGASYVITGTIAAWAELR